ncbi:MAG TPA: CinA family nicotinamide mononucleotide deamidase-related protein [Chloroflexi bacterium]|nr:CinA family nicotinamide mononucleotide deamidase-related protein [Chloroflexota bacterium]
MKAAILTIGDELTCGYRLDTNTRTIAQRLSAVPLDVVLHLTVGDDEGAIRRGLEVALEEADVVVAAGGLGPTEDDLTRQAVAAHFDLPLVEDAEALARIQARLARRGRPMSPSDRSQAQVPQGSEIIQNDRGTAPGFYLQRDDKHLFVTPGVPHEMEGMLEEFILPRLRRLVEKDHHVRRAVLKVYGLPEPEINERLGEMMARGRNPLLGLLPHLGTIAIEVVAMGRTAEEAESLLAADLRRLRERLGEYIISEDGRDLPEVVADLLRERGWSVAVAEVGTGGLVAARLSEPDGADRWLRGGFVFASVEQAARWAGMEEEADLAVRLATAARQARGTDVGIGVGPLAFPEGDPYGTVPVGIDLHGEVLHRRLRFPADPTRAREWAAGRVLALVREVLLEGRYKEAEGR